MTKTPSHSPTENLPFALAAERRQSIDVVHGAERELDRERHATQGHGHVEPLHLLRKTDEMLAAAEARRRDLELKRVIKTDDDILMHFSREVTCEISKIVNADAQSVSPSHEDRLRSVRERKLSLETVELEKIAEEMRRLEVKTEKAEELKRLHIEEKRESARVSQAHTEAIKARNNSQHTQPHALNHSHATPTPQLRPHAFDNEYRLHDVLARRDEQDRLKALHNVKELSRLEERTRAALESKTRAMEERRDSIRRLDDDVEIVRERHAHQLEEGRQDKAEEKERQVQEQLRAEEKREEVLDQIKTTALHLENPRAH